MNNDPQTKKPHFFSRLRNWVRLHRTRTYIIGGVVLVLIASVTAYFVLAQKSPEARTSIIKSKPKAKPITYYSPLTGRPVGSEDITKQAVTAIMIENSPDARPQSGLKDAGVVYEAIAEGGITRFLAIYQEAKPQLVGPVRSVRLYYVDWAAPYNASIAHVGGSKFALDEVRNGNYRDIDQFFNGSFYWRATDRYAPHNVYTSFEKLDALNKSKGYTESTFTGFPRTDGKASAKPDATSVAINISSGLYNTSYAYDAKTNTYLRSVGGAPHMDREKGQLNPDVVIAMKVNMTLVMEDGYRESITTNGSGEAVIFQNGTAQTVTWQKANRGGQIQFIGADGKEVKLNRGQTWISAVPNGSGSVSWQ